MSSFLSLVTSFTSSFHYDNDFFDRLSHRYTVLLLIIFCIVVSTKQYVGDPIQCWCPAYYTDAMVSYTNVVCWISNTYYVPFLEEIPKPAEPREDHGEIGYYQWVPLMLLVQALGFVIPNLFWGIFNDKTGIDIDKVVKLAMDIEGLNPEVRAKTVKFLVKHIDRYLETLREYRRGRWSRLHKALGEKCSFVVGKRLGNWLVALYLFSKVLYIANAIGQLFVLDAFIGSDFSLYGFEVIQKLINDGGDWEESSRFPRVTLCDFKIRQLGNIHRHTVQCALPINLFNEKIYIFIWFWMVFIASATIFSVLLWTYTFFLKNRVHFIRKYLRVLDKIDKRRENDMVVAFVEDYLRQDGAFVLRIMWRNTNDVITAETIAALWEFYKEKRELHPNGGPNQTPRPNRAPSAPTNRGFTRAK